MHTGSRSPLPARAWFRMCTPLKWLHYFMRLTDFGLMVVKMPTGDYEAALLTYGVRLFVPVDQLQRIQAGCQEGAGEARRGRIRSIRTIQDVSASPRQLVGRRPG